MDPQARDDWPAPDIQGCSWCGGPLPPPEPVWSGLLVSLVALVAGVTAITKSWIAALLLLPVIVIGSVVWIYRRRTWRRWRVWCAQRKQQAS